MSNHRFHKFTKLERYGIRGTCLDWFKSYLHERSLRLKCRTSDSSKELKSTLHQVGYRAPQGSCLGPLIFLIFTNDLYLNLMHTNCILFADDTTLYISHKKLSYAKWCMEEDLKTLQDWYNANKLTLNLNKTVSMLFKRNKTNKNLNLGVGNIVIPQVPETKFLGVWLDSSLNYHMIINYHIIMEQTRLFVRKQGQTEQTLATIFYEHVGHPNETLGVFLPYIQSPKVL